MIYSNPLNESNIILRGEEADSFLEFYGVTLFADTIAIGEMVMDGIAGEKILAENGITLNENHIVLEGKYAEEYKARKAKEKEDMIKQLDHDVYRYYDYENHKRGLDRNYDALGYSADNNPKYKNNHKELEKARDKERNISDIANAAAYRKLNNDRKKRN